MKNIEQAREIAAVALEAQGRMSIAGMIRAGIADDNPAVQQALDGEDIPSSPDVDHSEPVQPEPVFTDMGEVANVADEIPPESIGANDDGQSS